jgi:hypothetical protein
MSHGKTKALAILVPPLLLALSFLMATVALAEAASSQLTETKVRFASHISDSGIDLGTSTFEAISAVTGSLTITDVAVTDVKATSAVVTWTTDEGSDSLVRYGTAPDELTHTATSPATGTDHVLGLANLTPDTEYFLEVESTDDEDYTAVDNNSGSLYRFTTLEAKLARRAFVGTVVGDPGDTVTLVRQGTEEEVTIILPDEYVLKTPGGPRAGTFEDGARAVILAQMADSDWVALSVLVKPVKPEMPVVGVVTGVGPTSMTVLDSKGNRHLLRLDGPVGDLVAGEVVTVFPGNSNHARGVVRAEEVRSRLKKLLDEITESEDTHATQEEWDFTGKRADALVKGLEIHGGQQLRALDKAWQRVPDEVKDKISAAKAKAQKEIEAAQSSAGKAKGKFRQSDSVDADDGQEGGGNSGDSPGKSEGKGQGDAGGQGNSGGNSGGGQDNSGNQGNAAGKGNSGLSGQG